MKRLVIFYPFHKNARLMKTLVCILAMLTLLTPHVTLAAEPKAAAVAESKPMPFQLSVDALDATGFVHNNKDGTKVRHNVTDKTVIKQGKADAKFADIKVGDTVSGLRTKTKTDGTEYDLVKVTKFTPAAKK